MYHLVETENKQSRNAREGDTAMSWLRHQQPADQMHSDWGRIEEGHDHVYPDRAHSKLPGRAGDTSLEELQDAFPDGLFSSPSEDYLLLRHPLGDGAARDPELGRLGDPVLMLDLETLGFLGRPLFLIGVFRPAAEGGWEVAQFLARDYAEEEAVIQAFIDCARSLPIWVSFNGKSFDVPVLRNRAAFYGVRLPNPKEHQDLLHVARRTYKGVLPNCRLKTLESQIFGRVRYRDLDGYSIPAAYHDFVRTGRNDEMIRILRHNRDDLATLARLHVHLAES